MLDIQRYHLAGTSLQKLLSCLNKPHKRRDVPLPHAACEHSIACKQHTQNIFTSRHLSA